jgi:exodeoxyribonuclease VII large subunit
VVPDINEEIDLIEKLRDRASRFMRNMIELENSKIANLAARPVLRDPTVMITSRLEIITSLRDRAIRSFQGRLAIAQEELQQVTARVRALSPQATLDRGYAVVQLADGSIARDSDALKDGEKLRIRLAKGETSATVTS